MKTYPIPMVPGPVKAHPDVLEAYRVDYGSADLEKEYVELYTRTEANLKAILQTKASVVIFLGEGMMALWGALKSCLAPGDRVLAIGTGVYGYGIGEMAAAVGAEVRTVGLPYNETLSDLAEVKKAIAGFKPKMITVVHCETPSGTLNPIEGLGRLKQEMGVPLLYVDAVSSIGGAPVLPDEWHIDLCLGGAQKCLAALPDTCFLCVSDRAWEVIDDVDYVGYDAIEPFYPDRIAQRILGMGDVLTLIEEVQGKIDEQEAQVRREPRHGPVRHVERQPGHPGVLDNLVDLLRQARQLHHRRGGEEKRRQHRARAKEADHYLGVPVQLLAHQQHGGGARQGEQRNQPD